jgi:BlaI family transcriptional regulator, penicillinase repressor
MAHKELTRAEEQVMQYLWEIEKGFLKDIVEKFPEPRPAYTTVSTVIRVLVKKGFIGYKTYGKINEYSALISKQNYFKSRVKPILSNYMSGSPAAFASFFASEQLNLSELEEIKKLVNEKIKRLKTKKK